MKLGKLPKWVWLIEAMGVVLVILAWRSTGFGQACLLAFGTALLLGIPLALMQQFLERVLTQSVTEAVTSSIAKAEKVRLSGSPVPQIPEELDLWPFVGVVDPRSDGQIELRLFSPGSVSSSIQPIDVMIVVTDPIGRTFTTDHRLNSVVNRNVTSWLWPNDFTSGDIRQGHHHAAFFVAPLSVGPSRRFGTAAEMEFEYRQDG